MATLHVSGSLIVLFNRENPDTRMKSGRELSVDYGVGYTVAPGSQLGASGYLFRQVSDDTQRGAPAAPDGNRGRVAVIGLFLRWYTNDGMGGTAKRQIDSGARNKTDGNCSCSSRATSEFGDLPQALRTTLRGHRRFDEWPEEIPASCLPSTAAPDGVRHLDASPVG